MPGIHKSEEEKKVRRLHAACAPLTQGSAGCVGAAAARCVLRRCSAAPVATRRLPPRPQKDEEAHKEAAEKREKEEAEKK